MKHIFVVHSHITYLVALGVIMQDRLDLSNVMILGEKYQSDYGPFNIKQVSVTESFGKLLKSGKFTKIFNANIEVDNVIDQFVQDDEFTAYVPVFILLNRYIITHPKCKKYNIIEEGLAAYYDYFNVNQHAFIAGNRWRYSHGVKGLKERYSDIKKIIRGVSPSILAIPTFYTAYASDPNICFYGLHDCTHSLSGNRQVLALNRIIEHYNIPTQYNLDNSIIWIGDPEIFIKCSDSEFDRAISRSLISYVNKYKENKVYVRFHQRETDAQRQKLIKFLQQANVDYEIMDNTSIMEVELAKASNVTMIGVYSSLLLYGGIMGHKSISICDYLPKSIRNGVEIVNKQVSIFYKFVEKINEYI